MARESVHGVLPSPSSGAVARRQSPAGTAHGSIELPVPVGPAAGAQTDPPPNFECRTHRPASPPATQSASCCPPSLSSWDNPTCGVPSQSEPLATPEPLARRFRASMRRLRNAGRTFFRGGWKTGLMRLRAAKPRGLRDSGVNNSAQVIDHDAGVEQDALSHYVSRRRAP